MNDNTDIKNREKNKRRENGVNRKGESMMQNTEHSYFNEGIIGLKELRIGITDIYSKAINNFKYFKTGNIKRADQTVSIISTKLFKDILSCYKFNPVVNYDSTTNQYEVIIDEIGSNGCGDTEEQAITMAVENTLNLADDYFDNIELYLRLDNTKTQYPYFLRIINCSSKEELLQVMSLDTCPE